MTILLCLFPLVMWCQRFNHYGIKEGLSCSFVVDIAVDKHDCVWVATDNGLCVYDGTRFSIFSTRNSSLSDNGLNALMYDAKTDLLWVATRNKVSAISCKSRQFVPLDDTEFGGFQFLAPASDGGVWAGCRGDGIVKYSSDGRLLESKRSADLQGVPGSFISIYDDKGRLFLGSVFEGMSIVDMAHHRVQHFVHDESDSCSLPGNQVYDFCRDVLGRLWVGTDHGLSLFDETEGTFRNFKHEAGKTTSLIADHIYSIEALSDGQLWISTDIGGISVLDPQQVGGVRTSNVVFRNIVATKDDRGLSSANIRKVVRDRFGNYWIANYGSGISCLLHSEARFWPLNEFKSGGVGSHKSVRGLYYDSQHGELWAGTDNEVMVFDSDNRLVRSYDLTPKLVRSNGKVYCIHKVGDTVYLGVRDNGLLKLDCPTGKIDRLDFGAQVDVNTVWEDVDGVLWLGTQIGAYCLKDGKIFRDVSVSKHLEPFSVFAFLKDDRGYLWVSTFGMGVYVYDTQKRLLKHLRKESKELMGNINCSLLKDRLGNVWVASEGGVTRFEGGRWDHATHITSKDGLQDEMVHILAEDTFGQIWIGTDFGISSYDQQTGEIQNYSYEDGIPYGNIQHSSVTKDDRGNLFFGTHNGVCMFSPNLLHVDRKSSDIQLLEHYADENEQRFRFCVADEAQRDIVEYLYRIRGMSDEWRNIGGKTDVYSHGMASGHYTFEVKARLRNVENSDTKIASWSFYISPPAWKSWWAILLYITLALLTALAIFRSYQHRLLLKSSLEMAQRNHFNEQRLNQERLKLFTNITHELRTPLTLLIGPLEDIKADASLPPELVKKVEVMHANSMLMLQQVNEMLEFRKTETHNRQLMVERCLLSKVAREVWLRFKDSNRNEAVSFEWEETGQQKEIYVDVQAVQIILSNLLSNALKYTYRGKIVLSVSQTEDKSQITVADTGFGISAACLPHIFERYYQGDGEHQQAGTGIGLAVVKSLADLHEATIEVSSHEGRGTTFTLTLKADEEYPHAIHKDNTSPVSDTPSSTEATTDARRIMLVVEDNKDIRDYIVQTFASTFQVLQAADGQEGWMIANQSLPDIIISDIMMPAMDGITMCRKLKHNMNTSHIPVILLTAKTSLEDQAEGYETGADAYLTKPFSARLIQACVQSQLDQMSHLSRYIQEHLDAPSPAFDSASSDAPPTISRLDAEFIVRLKEVVHSHISDIDFSIDDICRAIGLSHSTLYRKVKALTDLSINEFIRKQRLLYAMDLLTTSGHNVTEVAYLSGFSDIHYFIACFKKEFHQTPSTFINKKH